MEINIREAKEKDSETIAQFQVEMAMETEHYQLDLTTVSKGVAAVISQNNLGRYFIVEDQGKTIASLLITYEWSDWRNVMIWWIQSVFVIKEYRRKGIYTKLYQHIKNQVQHDANIGGIRLYVDKTNINAQKTYHKVGMNGEHYHLFEWMK